MYAAVTLLSGELVTPACVQARSSNPRGRACRPNGKGSVQFHDPYLCTHRLIYTNADALSAVATLLVYVYVNILLSLL